MTEIRKDYFSDQLVIVSTERSKHSSDFTTTSRKSENKSKCPLCPGNESMTPPADLVLVQQEGTLVKLADEEPDRVKGWSVRVFQNSNPALSPQAALNYGESPLYSEPALGYHYVASATPEHSLSFSKIPLDQWGSVLATIQEKTRWLYAQRGVAYVSIFINYRADAGAAFSHPHLELITLPRLPPIIENEAQTMQRSMYELGVCPMCSVVSIETGGPRQILVSDHHIAFSPWAPTHPLEFWIFPKKHQTSFLKIGQKEIQDLALILRSTLGGFAKVSNDAAFNLVFHISSEKKTTKQIHWHIEIYPQLSKASGFERGTGVHINHISPEAAAEALGAAARRELAELVGVV